MNAEQCWECGEKAYPMVTLRSPPAFEESVPAKNFCCVGHFWTYIDRIIKDRDRAKNLMEGINWDTKP
jgi:hypothetical protein